MNYATGCAFNLDELLINLDMSKLKFNCKTAEKITGEPHRKPVVKKVLREALKIILDDIIENNVTFELPTGGRKSNIHVKRYYGDDFMKLRQAGKWKDVDFIESNWSGNQLVLQMQTANTTKEKPIYLNNRYKDKLTQKTNEGKQYC